MRFLVLPMLVLLAAPAVAGVRRPVEADEPRPHRRAVFLDKLDIAEEMTKSGTVCVWPKFSGEWTLQDTCSPK
jgi:hypothetical protein